MSILNIFKKQDTSQDIKKVAEEQLRENVQVINSLRDYDQGKKDISTSNIERRLPDIRVTR